MYDIEPDRIKYHSHFIQCVFVTWFSIHRLLSTSKALPATKATAITTVATKKALLNETISIRTLPTIAPVSAPATMLPMLYPNSPIYQRRVHWNGSSYVRRIIFEVDYEPPIEHWVYNANWEREKKDCSLMEGWIELMYWAVALRLFPSFLPLLAQLFGWRTACHCMCALSLFWLVLSYNLPLSTHRTCY